MDGSQPPIYLPLTRLDHHPSIDCWFKRWLDITGALVGLLFLGILFLPIAIAIKLDSPGPIFYRQRRCGLWGQPFMLWKFRSMVTDAEQRQQEVPNQAQGLIFKNHRDPRVTCVGRFLRRTSLDEFPQFWNVLRGEMSLVGTRPPTEAEVAHYTAAHWRRLAIKPGLTGQWQVNGRSLVTNFEDIVRLDLEYQANWSRRHDLWLILKTILVLINQRGAY